MRLYCCALIVRLAVGEAGDPIRHQHEIHQRARRNPRREAETSFPGMTQPVQRRKPQHEQPDQRFAG